MVCKRKLKVRRLQFYTFIQQFLYGFSRCQYNHNCDPSKECFLTLRSSTKSNEHCDIYITPANDDARQNQYPYSHLKFGLAHIVENVFWRLEEAAGNGLWTAILKKVRYTHLHSRGHDKSRK